jgi:L-rhamnose-H+ transport protein
MPTPNPLLGVCLHWLGGLAAASFYLPYRKVRGWAWETYWLVGGFFSWIIAPWALALLLTKDLRGVLAHAPAGLLLLTWLFGMLWGLGGLTFGLSMRYLGMSLGYGVALGICAVCGTLIPPLFEHQLAAIAATQAGRYTLLGVIVCVIGIFFSVLAGLAKERELSDEAKRATVREFSFKKGILVALFCGLMSACFAFGLDAAAPLADLSAAAGTPALWTGLPKLVVILLGGFTSNAAWCLWLNWRNGTGRQYWSSPAPVRPGPGRIESRGPRWGNGALCALAGVTWYLQFFFYTMGATQMGGYGFSSWTLHMASIIIFSTLWGLHFQEWSGTSRRARGFLLAGIFTLVASTLVIGYGNYVGQTAAAAH